MLITEITQHLPTYIARIKLQGQVIATTITAANPSHARLLLAHLYGMANVVSVKWLDEQSNPLFHEKNRHSCDGQVLDLLILEANDEKAYFIAITVDI